MWERLYSAERVGIDEASCAASPTCARFGILCRLALRAPRRPCRPSGALANGAVPRRSGAAPGDTADANGRAKTTVRPGTIAGPTYGIITVPDLG